MESHGCNNTMSFYGLPRNLLSQTFFLVFEVISAHFLKVFVEFSQFIKEVVRNSFVLVFLFPLQIG